MRRQILTPIVILVVVLFGQARLAGQPDGFRPSNREVITRLADPGTAPTSDDWSSFLARSAADDSCPLLDSFRVTGEFAAIRQDSLARSTHMYVGAYWSNAVLRFRVDSQLVRDVDTLPIPYGTVWIADDLDRDGSLDLLLQRGDGFNGFLDIVSTSTWTVRQRFTFPGLNIVMYAQTVDLDGDGFPEVYFQLGSLGGASFIAVMGYDPMADSFGIIDQVQAPYTSYRRDVIADFDQDGILEFLEGNDEGIDVYEWVDSSIVYRTQAWVSAPGDDPVAHLIACRPKPGGVAQLLMGYSNNHTYNFWLLEPVEDNVFRPDTTMQYYSSEGSASHVGAVDSDCDGLDELVMRFYSEYQRWEWDPDTGTLVMICSLSGAGGLEFWRGVDFNWDGLSDWVSISPGNKVWIPAGGPCLSCDTSGVCSPPPIECVCVCHADPACDDVTDVLDVVRTIDVAFRGVPEQDDTAPLCWATQSDIDCNGATDVVDVIRMINVAFRGADASTEFCDPCL